MLLLTRAVSLDFKHSFCWLFTFHSPRLKCKVMGTSLGLSLVLERLPGMSEGLGSALVPTQK